LNVVQSMLERRNFLVRVKTTTPKRSLGTHSDSLNSMRQITLTIRISFTSQTFLKNHQYSESKKHLKVLCIQIELCDQDLRDWLAEKQVGCNKALTIFLQVAAVGMEHIYKHGYYATRSETKKHFPDPEPWGF